MPDFARAETAADCPDSREMPCQEKEHEESATFTAFSVACVQL
jgi:hypothetical protein